MKKVCGRPDHILCFSFLHISFMAWGYHFNQKCTQNRAFPRNMRGRSPTFTQASFRRSPMNKKLILVTAIAALLIGATASLGLWAFDTLLGDSQAASGPITAVPLAVAAESAATVSTEPTASTAGQTLSSAATLFEISQADSAVSFSIYEELAGQPKTVVGTTDQVAGQIAVDLSDQIGRASCRERV